MKEEEKQDRMKIIYKDIEEVKEKLKEFNKLESQLEDKYKINKK